MKTMTRIAMVLAATLVVGCDDDKPVASGAATANATAAMAPAASASAREGGRGEGTGEGKGEGRNRGPADEDRDEGSGEGKRGEDVCPPSVAGAKTTIRDTDSGVILEVVADAESARKEVADRAAALLERQAAASQDKAAHSGSGSGGGLGRCPIVIRGTKLTVEPIPAANGSPGGTRIQVDAEKPEEVDALRRETKQRLAALDEP